MNSVYTQQVIRRLAIKYGLPEFVIRKIVRYQFQFVKEKMGEGTKGVYDTFPTIRLLNLGTFFPRKGRIQQMGDGAEYEAKKRDIYKKKYGRDFDEDLEKRLNKDNDGTVPDKE